jgi:hypothetical protein
MSGKFEKAPETTQYHQLTNSTAFPDTWNTQQQQQQQQQQDNKHHHHQHFKSF